MRIDFARLNHVLIPKSKEDRDRFRSSWFGRRVLPLVGIWGSLTDEGRTLLVVAPLAGAVAADVQQTSAYFVFSILVGLLLGSLVASRLLVLCRATIRVTAPRRVTVGDDVTLNVTVASDAELRAPVAIRVRGPFLPWDGQWTHPSIDEVTLGRGERRTTTMKARFVARGLHHLDPFTAAIVAPLGLACGPRSTSEGVKVHVVPRIANVVRLPLVISAKHQPGGVALASKAGESSDLLGVRPYRRGDPVRDIHARTWARTGAPVVREYQQEYFTRVGVVLDTSTSDAERLEAAIELAAGVVAHLSHGEALIDVLVVGDTLHELTLGRSLGRLDQALELLAAVEEGPPLDATKLTTLLAPHLAKLSAVVVVMAGDQGPEQRLLEKKLASHGLASTSLVVDERMAKAIRAGEAIG